MEKYWRVLYRKLKSRNGQVKAQNKCKPTSIVVCCRFCGSTWRIWAILWVLRLLLITYSNSQRKNPTNRSNSPCRATETTIHNNWSRFTFILSFNLDILRYKFTIVRLFNILPYISLYFKQTSRLAACVGSLWVKLPNKFVPHFHSPKGATCIGFS